MSGSDVIVCEDAIVLRKFQGDLHEVEIRAGALRRTVLCRRSGRMNQYRIHCVAGDRVTVEISPYDLTRGRIVSRERAA